MLIPKEEEKRSNKEELQTSLSHEHVCKNPEQNSSQQNPRMHQNYNTRLSARLHPRDAGMVQKW